MVHVVFKDGRDGGSGSFLCPPGHANLKYSVYVYASNRSRDPIAIQSLDSTANDESLPESVRERAKRLLDDSVTVPSELWVRHTYGYFRSMYVPESGSRNVSDLISDRENTLPAERHAAVAMIREYFPDHEPRTDLIADSSYCYGAYACVKCGESVQYEARFDALAVFGKGPGCPKGGAHEWPTADTDTPST